MNDFETQHIPIIQNSKNADISQKLRIIFFASKEKGYDPIMQLMGYITSGDPSYITNHNDSRKMITDISKDELLEYFIRYYYENTK